MFLGYAGTDKCLLYSWICMFTFTGLGIALIYDHLNFIRLYQFPYRSSAPAAEIIGKKSKPLSCNSGMKSFAILRQQKRLFNVIHIPQGIPWISVIRFLNMNLKVLAFGKGRLIIADVPTENGVLAKRKHPDYLLLNRKGVLTTGLCILLIYLKANAQIISFCSIARAKSICWFPILSIGPV